MSKKKILFLIGFILTATACENTIPVDLSDIEPQLVLNAQFNAKDREHRVYVSETSRVIIRAVRDAEVTVEVDGKLMKAELLPEEQQEYYAGVYAFESPLSAGSPVKVCAKRDTREARAESVVTQPALISKVDTLRFMQQNFDSAEELFQFKVSFQDLPGASFYRIGVRFDFVVHMVDAEGRTKDVPSSYELPVSGASDPILGGGVVSISIFDLEPTYLAFTDDMFRDQTGTVRLSLPVSQLYPFYYSWEDGFNPQYATITSQYVPWLETLTLEGYHYMCAINNLENFGYEAQVLVEPTSLPCNVDGGLGFVTVGNRQDGPAIQGPEQYIDYRLYGTGNE